jgi:hypothetical protein
VSPEKARGMPSWYGRGPDTGKRKLFEYFEVGAAEVREVME